MSRRPTKRERELELQLKLREDAIEAIVSANRSEAVQRDLDHALARVPTQLLKATVSIARDDLVREVEAQGRAFELRKERQRKQEDLKRAASEARLKENREFIAAARKFRAENKNDAEVARALNRMSPLVKRGDTHVERKFTRQWVARHLGPRRPKPPNK